MSLKITFNDDAFQDVSEQSSVFEKPDYKKFNMRFNNIDLLIIDAIAKRDGVSRSQILNNFIEENLKEFVWSVAANERDEALLITEHAEYLSANHTKSNKDFAWDLWYESSTHDSAGYLWNSMHVLYEQINSGHAEQSVKNLKELFDKEKAKK